MNGTLEMRGTAERNASLDEPKPLARHWEWSGIGSANVATDLLRGAALAGLNALDGGRMLRFGL